MHDRDLAAVIALLEQLKPALDRRDRAKLNDIIGKLIARNAPVGAQWQPLAQIALHNGELSLARAAINLYVASRAGDPAADYEKATLLSQAGDWQGAYDMIRTLAPAGRNAAAVAFSRGTAALNLGMVDEARAQLEHVTQLVPHSGSAWGALAATVNFARERDLADRLIAAASLFRNAAPKESAAYHYALGKTHADRAEHAQAFAAFAQGARLLKSIRPYSRNDDVAEAQEAVRGYSAGNIAALARQQRAPTARTIFVTGLPRSGTTLVQQILTSHSDVSAGAEIGRLALLAADMGGASFPALSRYVGAQGMAPAARLWDHWMDERFPGSGLGGLRVVDKTCDNSRQLGLAAALLPDAPLIWMTRDPLDRAWSCFRHHFFEGMPWSNDLADIAAHFRLEDQLLLQWQQLLGDRLLVVPYEALVTDAQAWTRRILAHCGLAEQQAPFAPHENRGLTATASVQQVRRPINREGIGAAEPYRAFLGAFVEAYEAR